MITPLVGAALVVSLQAGAPPLIDFTKERLAFRQTVTDLFEAGKTDALEKRAAELRVKRPRFSSGTPMLFDFYEAFSPASQHVPESTREAYAKRVLLWAEAAPNSLVTTIARMKVAGYKAWKARGEGYPDTVTDEGWKEFRGQQLKAWDLARAAEQRGTVDAALYDEMLTLCKGMDKPRAELDATLAKLVALDPAFDQAYVQMANYLLPRWHGSATELHDFALRATEQSRSVFGSCIYARIAIVVALVERSKMVNEYPFEYRRLKEAFQDLDRRYPNSGRTVNFFAWFASRYGDYETARPLIERIARDWTSDGEEVWGGREYFERTRASVNASR